MLPVGWTCCRGQGEWPWQRRLLLFGELGGFFLSRWDPADGDLELVVSVEDVGDGLGEVRGAIRPVSRARHWLIQ